MKKHFLVLSVWIPVALYGVASAQEPGASPVPAGSASSANSSTSSEGPPPSAAPPAASQQQPLAGDRAPGELELERKRIDELNQRVTDLAAALDQARASEAEAQEGSASVRKLELYGFFDASFAKITPIRRTRTLTVNGQPQNRKVSFWDGIMPDHGQFLMTNINLYIASQLTHTVSSLVELRFGYQPLGEETNYSAAGMTQYQRTDTSVRDNLSGSPYYLGGMSVVRAQVRWQPHDAIGIMVGRFLTPFGIWNVDHGTPILPTVRYPALMTYRIIPLAQTGAQALGRFFVYDSGYVDYALTASNGRTPTDGWTSLASSYGGGIRLKFTHDTPEFTASFGGYGYAGTYKDVSKRIDSMSPFHVNTDVTEAYKEQAWALDAQVKFKGVWLQAEAAQRRVGYTTRPGRMYGGTARSTTEFEADFVSTAVYGFLGYELPLSRWIGSTKIMPYLMAERMTDNDNTYYKGTGYYAGLNVKPIPAVALKAEGLCYLHENDDTQPMPMNFWGLSTQVAVAF